MAGGGGLRQGVGVGACVKSCGHIVGEWVGGMWQGWGHVAGVGACGKGWRQWVWVYEI